MSAAEEAAAGLLPSAGLLGNLQSVPNDLCEGPTEDHSSARMSLTTPIHNKDLPTRQAGS